MALDYDQMPSHSRVFGNAEVVALLEKWLKAARLGSMNYVALAAAVVPDGAVMDFAGSIEMEESIPEVLDELKTQVQLSLAKKEAPPQDRSLDPSYVCYEVTKKTVGYDFLLWLVAAEMERRRLGAPAPLKVGFWAGASGQLGIEGGYRAQMFHNVVCPALSLFGAVPCAEAVRGRRSEQFRLREIIERARGGESVPRYCVPLHAEAVVGAVLGAEDPIVITLRESDAWPHRNSNTAAWLAFAREREQEGYPVIFVRDTAKAQEPLEGMATYPQASVSLPVRAALYERARVNFFVSNGPCDLALFGSRPWIRFQRLDDTSVYTAETHRWWEALGLVPGTQMPWCSPEQRIVLGVDTYEAITQAWKELTCPPSSTTSHV